MNNTLDMLVVEQEINKNVLAKEKRYRAISKMLRTTEEYKECKKLYDFYVCEIAKYIHNLGINNVETASIYFDLLLRNGILSVTGTNNYHLYKNDKECLSELLGVRTIGGISVCRHMSALASDILSIEYNASWLNCKYISSLKESEDREFLHAIVGITTDEGKILYDPTTSSFAARPKDEEQILTFEGRLAETYISFSAFAEPGDLILLNKEQYLVNEANAQELINVWYTPFANVNREKFNKLIKETKELYKDTQKEIKNLKDSISNIANEIVVLEESLLPHSDSPILKWQLHQSNIYY